MSDKFDVVETHSRYCDALDRGDADALVDVFTADATWTCGPMGTYRNHDGIRALCKLTAEVTGGAVMHSTSNHIVEIDGDTARLRCYLLGISWNPAEGIAPNVGGAGRYDVALVRAGDAWKIRQMDIYLSDDPDKAIDDRFKA
ncbi:nuclear transport factor 2 family protein [Nocardia harenae]|uniref:nuclear transport factor 2 family protein n=1 Tax=Nocardia harenae TaxID=358707 RepID=UPI0008295356|nr:nuclear transport factor 2 family protein [Nocardia harenae]